MAGPRPHLDLSPELCDQCGRCVAVCGEDAVNFGRSHIFIDWSSCGECTACAEACEPGAIRLKGTPVPAPRAEPGAATGAAAIRTAGAVTTVSGATSRVTGSGRTGGSAARASSGSASTSSAPRPTAPSAVNWSLPEVFAVLAVGLTLLAIKDVVLNTAGIVALDVEALVAVRAAVQLGYLGGLAGLLVWLARRHGTAFADAYGLVRTRVPSAAAWVFAGLIGLRLFAWLYGVVAQMLGWDPPLGSTSGLTELFGPGAFGLALGTVTIVVFGPLVEEIVFRGMLLSALRQMMSARLAIVASAVLFAASHLTPWTFVPLLALGLLLGWLTLSRRSVWPAVVLHALYNLVPLLAAFYVSGGGSA